MSEILSPGEARSPGISYQELLDLEKASNFNNIRVHNNNKILKISLN